MHSATQLHYESGSARLLPPAPLVHQVPVPPKHCKSHDARVSEQQSAAYSSQSGVAAAAAAADESEANEGSDKPSAAAQTTPSNPWRSDDSKRGVDDASNLEKGEAPKKERKQHDAKPAALTHAPSSSVRAPASKKELVLTLIGLALALLMAALDNTIVGTALPKIVADLQGTSDQYSWVVISYLLASTAFAPSYGRLSDLYGRRNVCKSPVA